MLALIAHDEEQQGRKHIAKTYTDRAAEAREQAHSIRALLADYREPAE
ncbi:MAG: hypothetical protein QM765_44720 [Myxococcales bacterium]